MRSCPADVIAVVENRKGTRSCNRSMAGGICTASTRNSAALSNTASAAMTNRRRLLLIAAGAGTGKTKALAHRVRLSRFVIADITDPKSVPAELQTTVPQFMVPFLPIIEGKKGGKKNQKPYSLLESLWIECKERVFEPLWYSSLDALVEAFDEKIIKRAEVRFAELLARKAEKMKGEYV